MSKNKILVIIMTFFSLVIVAVSFLYTPKKDSLDIKEVTSSNSGVNPSTTPNRVISSPVPIITDPVDREEVNGEEVDEEVKPSDTPDPNYGRDEKLAELWYNLRKGVEVKDTYNSLVVGIKDSLENGIIPQISARFNLMLVTEDDYGFNEMVLPTENGTLHVLNMVTPNVEGIPRAVIFITSQDASGKFKTITDNKSLIIVNSIGSYNDGESYYFTLGGARADSDLFGEFESQVLIGIQTDGKTSKFTEVSDKFFGLRGVTATVESNYAILSPVKPDLIPFFYVEVSNEGQSDSDLQLIVPISDEESVYTFINIEDKKVSYEQVN